MFRGSRYILKCSNAVFIKGRRQAFHEMKSDRRVEGMDMMGIGMDPTSE